MRYGNPPGNISSSHSMHEIDIMAVELKAQRRKEGNQRLIELALAG